jgi:hypothetical protein
MLCLEVRFPVGFVYDWLFTHTHEKKKIILEFGMVAFQILKHILFFCWPFDLVSSQGRVRLNIFTREKKKMQTYLKLYPSNLNFSSVAPCMDISRCMFITDIVQLSKQILQPMHANSEPINQSLPFLSLYPKLHSCHVARCFWLWVLAKMYFKQVP